MSQRNREGKRSARERLREEREREQAAERRKRTAKVAGGALGLLAVVGVIGVIAAKGGDPDDAPAAEPVVVGESDAPVTLAVYEDFRCPACGQFESSFRDTINELTDAGTLKVDYHLVTIIDGNMGGNGSKFAANAALCARDAGKFREYHDVLFENQPAESDDAFADKARLIDLAGDVEGLDTETFRTCVQEGSHDDWVEGSNTGFLNSDYNATPTVLLNGEDIYGDTSDPLTPERLRERVEELA
ncbi:DsbA family protein [Streptomyces litchfieldiae]|uniref:Thioredoxin domain-containing protein n=1 Tax=Streptomyces litchfieldiae TaxID=3075543 RepID=A0ABU2MTP0_9ACTN|nr:thioredoxin domain-containing protein [Streptomyces sp. DSM 44938]MDT0344683.1 thioredoxin domain-containing protein [Streptomyces sp. DSM 44938]